jgi:hypothetical protein
MSREAARRLVVYAAAVVFAAALVYRFRSLGGPYFEFPDTVQDHVAVVRWPSADAIVLSRSAARILPRGATVTILQPSAAPNYDTTHYLTGVGLMPHQRVVRPDLATLPDYVLALRDPLEHPSYRLLREIEGGRIYQVQR